MKSAESAEISPNWKKAPSDVNYFLDIWWKKEILSYKVFPTLPVYGDTVGMTITPKYDNKESIDRFLSTKLPSNWDNQREMDIQDIISEHFYLHVDRDSSHQREMIFNIDTSYKIALHNFMWDIKNNLKKMVFWNTYTGKLPTAINWWKFQSANKDHPYYQNKYRKKDSLNVIKEYLWTEEYNNISTWIDAYLLGNLTCIQSQKIPTDAKIYDQISSFYTSSPIHLLRIQLAESLAKEYLSYLAHFKRSYFCEKFDIPQDNLKSINIFSTNKVDDIRTWTDFVFQLGYFNPSNKASEIKTMCIDIKNRNYNSELIDTKYKAKLIWKQWIKHVSQTNQRKKIKGKIIKVSHLMEDNISKKSVEDQTLHILQDIQKEIQWIYGTLNSWITNWDYDELIEYLSGSYKKLEEDLLIADGKSQLVINALSQYVINSEEVFTGYKVDMPLPVGSTQLKKQFALDKKLMSSLFKASYESARKYWFVNFEDTKTRNKFDSISKREKESLKREDDLATNFEFGWDNSIALAC